jgi:hypothetical protein
MAKVRIPDLPPNVGLSGGELFEIARPNTPTPDPSNPNDWTSNRLLLTDIVGYTGTRLSAQFVPTSRAILTPNGGGLSGGGALSADISLMLDVGNLNDLVTAPEVADILPVKSTALGTTVKTTVANFFRGVFGLTSKTPLNADTDYLLVYDSAAAEAVKTPVSSITAAVAGLPAGGATGQVLQKNSGSNYDTGWVTAALQGDVAGSGQFPMATTIQSHAVTFAKFQQIPATTLIANPTGSVAEAQAVTLGSSLAFSGTTLTIASNGVTYGQMQQVGAAKLLGNPAAAASNASEISLGATLAFSGSALQTEALTGDVTTAANSFVTAIAPHAVTNAKLAQMPAGTVKANVTGAAANPTDATPSQVLDVIGNTRGSVIYRGASGWSMLTPGTSGQVLTTQGSGADPAWTATGTGNVTGPNGGVAVGEAPVFANTTGLLLTGSGKKIADLVAGPTVAVAGQPVVFADATGKAVKAAPSGAVVQSAYAEMANYFSTTAVIPIDNTPPQISEGLQIVTLSITPVAVGNRLRVRASLLVSSAAVSPPVNVVSVALFIGSGPDAVAATALWNTNQIIAPTIIEAEVAISSASPISIQVRAGTNNASMPIYINGNPTAGLYGPGTTKAVLIAEEILA